MKSKTEVKTDFISDFQVFPDFSDKVATWRGRNIKDAFLTINFEKNISIYYYAYQRVLLYVWR